MVDKQVYIMCLLSNIINSNNKIFPKLFFIHFWRFQQKETNLLIKYN